MKKIFYCWQSTTPGNRSFIKKALERAVKNVSGYEIDEATRGEIGAPDINESVLNKIQDADLFVADLTIINPDAKKQMINSNVAFETGYAFAKKTKQQMILIADRRVSDDKQMPFDLRNLRITYLDFDQKGSKDLEEIFELTLRAHVSSPLDPLLVPDVSIELAAHSSEGTMHIKVNNRSDRVLTLNALEIGGVEIYADYHIAPNQTMQFAGLSGLPHTPYETKIKYMSYVVSDSTSSYRIKQRVSLGDRADGKYNLEKFDQRHADVQKLNLWRSNPEITSIPTSADGLEYKVTDYDTEKSFTLKVSNDAFVKLGSRYVTDHEKIVKRFAYAYNNKFEGKGEQIISITTYGIDDDINSTLEKIV